MEVFQAERGARITSCADLFFRPGERLLSRFSTLDQTRWPLLWVAGLFLAQAIPATLIRASNLEEGRIIAIARGAMEDGHWLTPFIYGQRFAERPVLLSWIAALFGKAAGGVTLWSLRVPHLFFFFVGSILIYRLLRSCTGKSAAIFGVLCWICMPMVAAKFINSEPDIVLSTLLFAAFSAWWHGTANKCMSPLRWLCIGGLICLAGLTKGPQPVAYFALGVGAYLCLKRRDQVPAFLAVNAGTGLIIGGWFLAVYSAPGDINYWLLHSRLLTMTSGLNLLRDHLDFAKSIALETLPAAILLGPAVVIVARRWRESEPDLMLAAVLYSFLCTFVLACWPGGVAARYAMPMTMTLAVMCGLMFERWRSYQPRVIASALLVCCLIYGGLLVRGWIVMPILPDLFQASRIAGRAVAAHLQQRPGPLYVINESAEYNMLAYVTTPMRQVALDELARLDTPATAVLLPEELRALSRQTPMMQFVVGQELVSLKQPYSIVEIYPIDAAR
jgi:4-amino-4-deoxy-L-arabinose transferase-like glycosyltransferase